MDEGSALSLLHAPLAEVQLPEHCRPGDGAVPELIPLDARGVGVRVARLPVRLRSMFFGRPPDGMELVDTTGEVIPHQKQPHGDRWWSFDRETVDIHGVSGDVFLRYPRAREREERLNLASSGLQPEDFVRVRAQADTWSHAGLLLPAPGVAGWDLTVPPAGELHFRPGLVRPEVADGPASDGATLTWEIEVGGVVSPVWSEHVSQDDLSSVRVDLSAWSGQEVRLRLRSEPGNTSTYDYAFVGEPVVASRLAHPSRIIVVFVDTVRADHLAPWGYERDTMPAVSAWSEGAVLFEQARSTAPWTLPSVRSLFTSQLPDDWATSPTLQEQLAAEGWATAFLTGNVYLSANFGMDRGFGLHRAAVKPSAEEQVDLALRWLEEVEGRDGLLVLHFMDAHLPYEEPLGYRRTFAGDRPELFSKWSFSRGAVMRVDRNLDDASRQWLRDRYDNNLRYMDDQIARLLDVTTDDDVVVFLADHGEEFWDHHGYEHGHSLFDELLHVPLIVHAPGLPPGVVTEPVSLLDLAPTLLDLTGHPVPDGLRGQSLVPLAHHDPATSEAFAARDQVFGWPLYGSDRWGVLHSGHKYSAHEGREALYDLRTDPGELDNLALRKSGEFTAPWRERTGEALGRPVHVCYRLDTRKKRLDQGDLTAVVTVPGGALAWPGSDPTASTHVSVEVHGDEVRATWPAGGIAGREVYILPKSPLAEVTNHLQVKVRYGESAAQISVHADRVPTLGVARTPMGRARAGSQIVSLGWGIVPEPPEAELVGYDDEVRGALEVLGYVDPVTPPPPEERPQTP